MSQLIDKILKHVDEIPSLPTSVAKILEVTQDPYASPNSLNKVISLDPILTGKVLKLVNSAYYSLSTKVTSIVKAIILLGVNTIRNLALTTAVVPMMGTQAKRSWMVLDVHGYWKHSLGTGVLSKLIAKHLGVVPEEHEEYFICGFLHDIGKVILDHALQEEYLEIIKKSEQTGKTLHEVETEILSINHCEIGKLIAEKWSLSPNIIESIYYHHNPSECSENIRQMIYSVSLANLYCNHNNIGFSGDYSKNNQNQDLLNYLHLTEDILSSWLDEISNEIKNASVFLKIQQE